MSPTASSAAANPLPWSVDPVAFARVVRQHTAIVTHVVRAVVGEAAEDVVQEVFLSAWRSRERFDPARGSLASWLCGIARNRAIDALRSERRRVAGVPLHTADDGELMCPRESPEDAADRGAAAGAVRRALATLNAEQRTVLVLAYFGGLSQTEIQRSVQVPLGTVKGRARLGLDAMRAQLPFKV